MPRKLSKTDLALIFFTLTLILSIVGIYVMVSIYHPVYSVAAFRLDEKPQKYIVLDNPDSYVIEAIRSQSTVFIPSPQDTKIREITSAYDGNIEYNGIYYKVGLAMGDKFPPAYLPLTLLVTILISATALLVTASLKATNYLRNRKVS